MGECKGDGALQGHALRFLRVPDASEGYKLGICAQCLHSRRLQWGTLAPGDEQQLTTRS